MLRLLARGLDHPQIERDHGIPVRNSRLLLREAMTALGAVSVTHAVALAIGHGLLPHDTALHQE